MPWKKTVLVDKRMKARVVLAAVFAVLIAGAYFFVIPLLTRPGRGPTFETSRERQRQMLSERLSRAGLTALVKECEAFVESHRGEFLWPDDGRELPASLAALEPKRVEFDSSRLGGPIVITVRLFGHHRTGMRPIPRYDLLIVCGPAAEDFVPPIDEESSMAFAIRKISDRVFEVVQTK